MKPGPKPTSLVGQRFGRLVVVKLVSRPPRKSSRWLCKCNCGNEHEVSYVALKNGSTKSCGCLQRDLKLEPEEAARRSLYAEYKRTAKRKNLPFELGYERFVELTIDNCYYCGAAPTRVHKADHGRGECAFNGIDRLANSGSGYTEGNIVTACWFCNRTKRETPYQDFIEWIAKVHASLTEKGEIE